MPSRRSQSSGLHGSSAEPRRQRSWSSRSGTYRSSPPIVRIPRSSPTTSDHDSTQEMASPNMGRVRRVAAYHSNMPRYWPGLRVTSLREPKVKTPVDTTTFKALRRVGMKISGRIWTIDARQISFEGPHYAQWKIAMDASVRAQLHMPAQRHRLNIQLTNMLLVGADSHKELRLGDIKSSCHRWASLGTVLVDVPGLYSGGEIALSCSGHTQFVHRRASEQGEYSVTAWRSDTTMKMQPVLGSHRVALVYDIVDVEAAAELDLCTQEARDYVSEIEAFYHDDQGDLRPARDQRLIPRLRKCSQALLRAHSIAVSCDGMERLDESQLAILAVGAVARGDGESFETAIDSLASMTLPHDCYHPMGSMIDLTDINFCKRIFGRLQQVIEREPCLERRYDCMTMFKDGLRHRNPNHSNAQLNAMIDSSLECVLGGSVPIPPTPGQARIFASILFIHKRWDLEPRVVQSLKSRIKEPWFVLDFVPMLAELRNRHKGPWSPRGHQIFQDFWKALLTSYPNGFLEPLIKASEKIPLAPKTQIDLNGLTRSQELRKLCEDTVPKICRLWFCLRERYPKQTRELLRRLIELDLQPTANDPRFQLFGGPLISRMSTMMENCKIRIGSERGLYLDLFQRVLVSWLKHEVGNAPCALPSRAVEPIGCGCSDCGEINKFLVNSTESVRGWALTDLQRPDHVRKMIHSHRNVIATRVTDVYVEITKRLKERAKAQCSRRECWDSLARPVGELMTSLGIPTLERLTGVEVAISRGKLLPTDRIIANILAAEAAGNIPTLRQMRKPPTSQPTRDSSSPSLVQHGPFLTPGLPTPEASITPGPQVSPTPQASRSLASVSPAPWPQRATQSLRVPQRPGRARSDSPEVVELYSRPAPGARKRSATLALHVPSRVPSLVLASSSSPAQNSPVTPTANEPARPIKRRYSNESDDVTWLFTWRNPNKRSEAPNDTIEIKSGAMEIKSERCTSTVPCRRSTKKRRIG